MTPRPGDFFLTHGSGLYPALIRWGTQSTFNHAGVLVADGMVVEAQPGGAVLTPVTGYLGEDTVWSGGYGITGLVQRDAIVAAATSLVGTPYGWPDIVAISLAQQRLGHWRLVDAEKSADQQPWWVNRLADVDCLICSQLVDLACHEAGVILFDDGRPGGLVSPGDLGRLLSA